MLSWPANVRVFLCRQATDMRKQFDGLHALVAPVFGRDVLDGHLFLFVNRRRDRVKILYWDRDGLALWGKRLEAGCFQLPAAGDDQAGMEVDATTLSLILGGIDLSSVRRRKRFLRPTSIAAAGSAESICEKVS